MWDWATANQRKKDAVGQLAPLADALDDLEVRIADLVTTTTQLDLGRLSALGSYQLVHSARPCTYGMPLQRRPDTEGGSVVRSPADEVEDDASARSGCDRRAGLLALIKQRVLSQVSHAPATGG